MKILHTESSCGWGGQELRIIYESVGLVKKGHEVFIACPSGSKIALEASRVGLSVIGIPIEKKSVRAAFKLREVIKVTSCDVINTHSSIDSWLVAVCARSINSAPPIVRTRHISARIRVDVINRWLYRQAKHIVTTGESIRLDIVRTLGVDPKLVTSIPTGVDVGRFFPADDKVAAKNILGLSPNSFYVGIIATLRSWKGHLFLIDSFRFLKGLGLRLLVIGDGPMRKALESRVAELGLSDVISFIGETSAPEHWFRAIDVFCLPSYANEGVSQAVMQAMCSRVPVVTTGVGSLGDIARHGKTAWLVEPKNSDSIGNAIATLYSSPNLRDELAIRGYAFARQRCTLESTVDAMEDVFRRVVDENP